MLGLHILLCLHFGYTGKKILMQESTSSCTTHLSWSNKQLQDIHWVTQFHGNLTKLGPPATVLFCLIYTRESNSHCRVFSSVLVILNYNSSELYTQTVCTRMNKSITCTPSCVSTDPDNWCQLLSKAPNKWPDATGKICIIKPTSWLLLWLTLGLTHTHLNTCKHTPIHAQSLCSRLSRASRPNDTSGCLHWVS